MNDKILNNLNDEQKKAVLQMDGPILIIAGAGSGKTRVLTSKIAKLLYEGVRAEEILALTFTKKAAEEMKGRVRDMVGSLTKGLAIGTFHSVFIQFLRMYHEYVGFPEDFTIYDENDSESCLKECIGEVLFGPDWNNKKKMEEMSEEQRKFRKTMFSIYKPHVIHSTISYAKNELILPKVYKQDNDRTYIDAKNGRPKMPEIYELYMKKCRKAGAMDFDDILVYMAFLLKMHPEITRQLAGRFRYILVDEYQDTNMVQYMIVEQLASVHHNICVVGDDSQSIYAFRGAKIQNIINFQKRYPNMKTFRLETNYRSTTQIVDAANRLIAHNATRLPKTCVASRGLGEDITLEICEDNRDEAAYIANTIQDQILYNGAHYNDFAILYRTNAQARAIEDALMKTRVPYLIYSGVSFFERAEIKDVLAYCRLTVNPSDNEAFKRICNKPSRGISDATLSAILAVSARTGESLSEIAANATIENTGLKQKACDNLRAFAELMKEARGLCHDKNASEAIGIVIEKTGILDYYRSEEGEDGLKKSSNILELINSVDYFIVDRTQEWEDDLPDGPLRIGLGDYLENIALLSNADTKGGATEYVSLMTSHCSKGLEFRNVFVAGVEESLFPLIREDSTAFDEEEERRLFYVSITRAMNKLYLTTCNHRFKYGAYYDTEPSRFLSEMGILISDK